MTTHGNAIACENRAIASRELEPLSSRHGNPRYDTNSAQLANSIIRDRIFRDLRHSDRFIEHAIATENPLRKLESLIL